MKKKPTKPTRQAKLECELRALRRRFDNLTTRIRLHPNAPLKWEPTA